MSVRNFDVGADLSALTELGEDQRQYLLRFQAIMGEIHQEANDLVTRWEGGEEQYQARAEDFNAAFEEANRGFSKMVDAVDGTVDGWRDTKRYLMDLFE